MYPGWLIGTALLIAIYCLIIFLRKTAAGLNRRCSSLTPKISLLFLVKNQEDSIEGLVRRVFADACDQSVELIVVDTGSLDSTVKILELMVKRFEFKFFPIGEVPSISRKIRNLCHGNLIYCFDLTSSINYGLMANTIDSILVGSKVGSLYRTRILYRQDACV